MAIKRYISNADTTITNAYKATLSTRGTGSNMGESDVLEIFSILGQASTSSLEKSRALLNFPVSQINTDRSAGSLPESGSVKFYLRVFNCPHGQTLPKQFDLQVLPLSRSWTEGTGLDMEEYTDEGEANWVMASTDRQPHIVDVKFSTVNEQLLKQEYFTLYDSDNKRRNFVFLTQVGESFSGSLPGKEIIVPLTGNMSSVKDIASVLSASVGPSGETGLSASISFDDTGDSTGATVRISTTGSTGTSGSFQGTVSTDHMTITTVQYGGKARWITEGGDFHEVGYTAGKNLPHYSQNFQKGTEDLEVNITALVEEWLAAESTNDPDRNNYGVMLKLSGSFEDGSSNRSYYTKKFFSRGSEFFYKRPMIEARWDDAKTDDRNNFYLSSSLVMPADNLNKLYLYNIVRGKLSNIPNLRLKPGTAANTGSAQHYNTKIYVQVYPSGNVKSDRLRAKRLPIGGGVTVNNATTVTGSWVSTGIYSASFAFTGSEKEIFEVWSAGPHDDQLVTGSVFTVKKQGGFDYNPNPAYVTSIKNMKASYSQSENARFRVFIREKDWQPNVYTVATKKIEPTIIENGYYRVYRVTDQLDVIPFGTGSGQQSKYTRMSYDKNGNYFDLDMSMFESDYAYAIQLAYEIGSEIAVQDEIFKFRVDK